MLQYEIIIYLGESGLNVFLNELKDSAQGREKSVLDYVRKNLLNSLITETKPLKEDLSLEKFSNDFMTLREKLATMQKTNERACRMKINEFVVGFEESMQVIISLANFYEQKTLFEIEKERNSILEIINSDSIDSNTKLNIVIKKLDDLREIIMKTFEEIIQKIKNYEDISTKKIARAKNSFYLNIKKFLK